MLNNENGIIGLQICLIVIASVAVPPVLAYSVFTPMQSNIQKTRTSICQAPQRALLPLDTGVDVSLELCKAENAWTAFTDVKATSDEKRYVEGESSIRLEVDDSFKSGPIACGRATADRVSPEPSGTRSVSLWIKSDTDIADDILQFRLTGKSNNSGETGYITVPIRVTAAEGWKRIEAYSGGSYLFQEGVETATLYAEKDPGAVTIWLDILEIQLPGKANGNYGSYLNELVYSRDTEELIAG